MGDSHRLATGGCSGKLCLWDLRRPHTVEVEIPPYLDLNGAAKEENGEASASPGTIPYDGSRPSDFQVNRGVLGVHSRRPCHKSCEGKPSVPTRNF